MNKLTFFINKEVVYEYDKSTVTDEEQLTFLDKMDADMGVGIKIHGKLITSPDNEQRVRFVVMNLIKALQQENSAIITASFAYLVNRRLELDQIHVNDGVEMINIEFINKS